MTGHQGESTGILARQGSLQIPAERPGVDKGNRQYEEKQYPDGKVLTSVPVCPQREIKQ